jgi:preprotein translocase SecE subunit
MIIIHKPGQGYWTRLMSLIAGGTIVAAGAMWLWSKLSVIDVPVKAWTFALSSIQGSAPGAGERVAILGRGGEEIGSGLLDGVVGNTMTLSGVNLSSQLLSEVAKVSTASGFAADSSIPGRIALFQLEYLQGGAAAVILIIGGALVYYFCYVNRRSSDFLIATEGEMKKVNWSTRREVLGSTWVVIVISLIIAAVLFAADFLFSQFFTLIRVIDIA